MLGLNRSVEVTPRGLSGENPDLYRSHHHRDNIMNPSARAEPSPTVGRWRTRTGIILTALAAIFLFVDGVLRLVGFAPYVEGTVHAGFSAEDGTWIGLVLIVSTLLYVISRTALFGAILVTAYLGAATATHLQAGDPFFFPILFGVWIWAALYFRDPRLRDLVHFQRP